VTVLPVVMKTAGRRVTARRAARTASVRQAETMAISCRLATTGICLLAQMTVSERRSAPMASALRAGRCPGAATRTDAADQKQAVDLSRAVAEGPPPDAAFRPPFVQAPGPIGSPDEVRPEAAE
jgi:hypothetical protein